MKLYYSPGACSLSPHIVASEAGIPVELDKVNLAEHKTESGQDYMKVNPKGYVPALRLDDGSVLTEGPAIVQYLADQNPSRDSRQRPTLSSVIGYRSGSTSSAPNFTRTSGRSSTRPRQTRLRMRRRPTSTRG